MRGDLFGERDLLEPNHFVETTTPCVSLGGCTEKSRACIFDRATKWGQLTWNSQFPVFHTPSETVDSVKRMARGFFNTNFNILSLGPYKVKEKIGSKAGMNRGGDFLLGRFQSIALHKYVVI